MKTEAESENNPSITPVSAEWRRKERSGSRGGRRERRADQPGCKRDDVASRERPGQSGTYRHRRADEERRATALASKRDQQQREHTVGEEDGGTREANDTDLEASDTDLGLGDQRRFKAIGVGEATSGTAASRRTERVSASLRSRATASPSGTTRPASSRRHDGLQRLRGA